MDPTTEVEIETPSTAIPKPKMAMKLPLKELQTIIRASQSMVYLQRLMKKTENILDETRRARVVRELQKRERQLSRELVAGLPKAELKLRLAAQPSFAYINKSRNRLAKAEDPDLSSIRVIEKHLEGMVHEDGQKMKKRKEGTGRRVEQKMVYKDTPENRKRGRVGQEYTRVIWEGAEYEEVDRKLRKVKRRKRNKDGEEGEGKPNVWIQALRQAKEEAGVAKGTFIVVKKQSDDPDDLGVKVYQRAVEIMQELRASKEE